VAVSADVPASSSTMLALTNVSEVHKLKGWGLHDIC
jgi:hypothetical protein